MSDLFGEPQMADISDRQKLESIRREIKYRRRVYPRLVDQGKMRKRKADDEILIFKAIERDYMRRVSDASNTEIPG